MVLFTMNTQASLLRVCFEKFSTQLKPRFGLPVNDTEADLCYIEKGQLLFKSLCKMI